MTELETNSASVLVADSETRVLEQVSTTLEKAGYTVFTSLGKAGALEFCRKHSEPLQLAIVDMAVAGDNPELLVDLYRRNPGLRILFTSSHDDAEAAQQVGPAGHFRGFLKKPFRRSQLLGRVLDAIDAPLTLTA